MLKSQRILIVLLATTVGLGGCASTDPRPPQPPEVPPTKPGNAGNDPHDNTELTAALKANAELQDDLEEAKDRIKELEQKLAENVRGFQEFQKTVARMENERELATAAAGRKWVRLTTSEGELVLELDASRAPETVKNFLEHVKRGHYDGTVFHRVIPDFMIQGGGMDEKLNARPEGAPIPNEGMNGLSNVRGTIAMARAAEPNSATCQFFINVADNRRLDACDDRAGFAVFGRVLEGMEVVDRIQRVPTMASDVRGPHGIVRMTDVPNPPVCIQKATEVPGPTATGKAR